MKISAIPKAVKIVTGITTLLGLWQGIDFAAAKLSKSPDKNTTKTEKETTNKDTTRRVIEMPVVENKTKTSPPQEPAPHKLKPIKYFNTSEKVPEDNSIAFLLISPSKTIQKDLQNKLSDLMIQQGINNSATLFENSVTYYDKFRDANKTWLAEIKLAEHIGSYLIGKVNEERSTSSVNQKIKVANISFDGRLVTLNPYRIYPIRLNKKGSSFNEMDAIEETYDELANAIIDESIKALKGSPPI